jgi:heat shock protein HslJ
VTPNLIRSRLVLLVALVFALAACGGEAGPSGPPPSAGGTVSLADTAWTVISVAGRPPVPGAVPSVTFSADAITGSGGCNSFGGRYQFEPSSGRIAIRDLGMTAMGCVQAGVGEFETAFVQALGAATEAGLDPAGQLVLSGPSGRIILARPLAQGG